MVKLKFNLDEISSSAYDTGRVRAKLKSINKKPSRAGNPMLVFAWRIQTGPNKGQKISSYPSLMEGSLGNLKEHLEALGLSGEVSKSSDSLLGKTAVLVIGATPSKGDDTRPYVGVVQVLPKGSSLKAPKDDEEEFDEDEDEEDDDDGDDEEDDE